MTSKDYSHADDGTKIVSVDPWLEPFVDGLRSRYAVYKSWSDRIKQNEGGLANFAQGFQRFGLHVDPRTQAVTYREYAPGVQRASLIGDFNGWNRESNEMTRDDFGNWSVTVPAKGDGTCAIEHGSKVKISMVTPSGERIERLPAWIE